MTPLDDVLETNLTISTLSSKAEGSSKKSTVSSGFVSTQQSSQPSSAPLNTENTRTNCSEVESSNISSETSTPMISPVSETLMPTLTTIKKQKIAQSIIRNRNGSIRCFEDVNSRYGCCRWLFEDAGRSFT